MMASGKLVRARALTTIQCYPRARLSFVRWSDEIPDDDRNRNDQQPDKQIEVEEMVADLPTVTRACHQVLPKHLMAKF
jgi:hypothetical protein